MARELTIIEPIPLPDVRRPAKLTMLPPWVAQRCDICRKENQAGPSGKHREIPVLPRSLILGKEQKMVVEKHIAALTNILAMTPYEDVRHGELTLTTVSKMTMVLPCKESGDLAGEAKGEAYMAALEDVPNWAVQEAMRKWHRSEYGDKYDYVWQPGPSTLRDLAMIETYRVMATRRKLTEILLAEPLVEFSEEHRSRMKEKVNPSLRRM